MARTGKPQVIAHRTNGEAINHLITEVYLAGRRIRITPLDHRGLPRRSAYSDHPRRKQRGRDPRG